jgi:predicted HD phosphohydrolase
MDLALIHLGMPPGYSGHSISKLHHLLDGSALACSEGILVALVMLALGGFMDMTRDHMMILV